jgi:tripartite ATP-independent transporter DctP family solute receptor
MDGELGAYVRGQIAKANLVAMDKIWDNGFRQTTTSTKPINGPEDLRGLKIRVPVSPMWTSMFKAFDAAPTSINASEMYTALQTKVVDAQENPVSVISLFKLNEVQKFCSLTNHMWDGFWFLANRRAWERLPAPVREIAARHLNAAAMTQRADMATLNAGLQQEIAAKGMVFNTPRTEPFRDKLRSAGYYSEWKNKFGSEAWAVLERNTGKLA